MQLWMLAAGSSRAAHLDLGGRKKKAGERRCRGLRAGGLFCGVDQDRIREAPSWLGLVHSRLGNFFFFF